MGSHLISVRAHRLSGGTHNSKCLLGLLVATRLIMMKSQSDYFEGVVVVVAV